MIYRDKFTCPRHHCFLCRAIGPSTRPLNATRRSCFYCPRVFHRNCAPPLTVLPAAQLTDNMCAIQKLPDWKFDAFVCDFHPPAQVSCHCGS